MAKKAKIPVEIRNHVFSTFECCAACGTWDADECGHLIAESKGGAMTKENFVRLCGWCNRTQGSANIAFAAYAPYTEEPAIIRSRRAYWATYCKAARGEVKLRPYRPD